MIDFLRSKFGSVNQKHLRLRQWALITGSDRVYLLLRDFDLHDACQLPPPTNKVN